MNNRTRVHDGRLLTGFRCADRLSLVTLASGILIAFLATACQSGKADPPVGERMPIGTNLKETMASINQHLAEKDKDIIEHYIRRQGWNLQFCTDGYYYEVLDAGSAPKASQGSHVTYDYTIKQLDGTLCYTSVGADPASFVVGGSEEISGMHLAVKRLGKGGKARLIFPPQLAYGLQGDLKMIPRRAVLVYFVEILEVS